MRSVLSDFLMFGPVIIYNNIFLAVVTTCGHEICFLSAFRFMQCWKIWISSSCFPKNLQQFIYVANHVLHTTRINFCLFVAVGVVVVVVFIMHMGRNFIAAADKSNIKLCCCFFGCSGFPIALAAGPLRLLLWSHILEKMQNTCSAQTVAALACYSCSPKLVVHRAKQNARIAKV